MENLEWEYRMGKLYLVKGSYTKNIFIGYNSWQIIIWKGKNTLS